MTKHHDHKVDKILESRAHPDTPPQLVQRIIDRTGQMKQQNIPTWKAFLTALSDEFCNIFVLPRPEVAIAAMLILGVATGVSFDFVSWSDDYLMASIFDELNYGVYL